MPAKPPPIIATDGPAVWLATRAHRVAVGCDVKHGSPRRSGQVEAVGEHGSHSAGPWFATTSAGRLSSRDRVVQRSVQPYPTFTHGCQHVKIAIIASYPVDTTSAARTADAPRKDLRARNSPHSNSYL